MSSDAATQLSYLDEGAGPRAWLLTTDHKRVAWLYLVSLTVFFFLGGASDSAQEIARGVICENCGSEGRFA